jgi:hypothetical protein
MVTSRLGWIFGLGLALAAASPLFADTVVLGNGARLTGEVRVGRDSVTVRSADGELVLPLWRVLRVEGKSAGSAAMPARPAAPTAEAPAESEAAPAVAQEPASPVAAAPKPTVASRVSGGPTPVRQALARRIDIDFEGVSVEDVLIYIREVTGVNMAIAPEVRLDTMPVSLHLRNVRIEEILDLVLEPRGLGYSIRPGDILYFHSGATQKMVTRVYPVADLLVSTEDRFGGGNSGLGGGTGGGLGGNRGGGNRTSGTRGGGSFNPQFTGPQAGAQPQAARISTTGTGANSGLAARAGNLILLIKNTCGRGTWEDPADPGVIDADTGN